MLTLFRALFAPPRHLILLIVAAWIGLIAAEKRTPRHGIPAETLNNLIFAGLIAYILGGRLFYVLSHLSAFIQSPLSLVSLNLNLFDGWGAAAASLMVGFIYGQRKGLPPWQTLDALTPFFAILAVGIGFSHLASGEAFGKPTNVPWAIYIWGARRHPSQMYEILASLLILGLLWLQKPVLPPGAGFLLFAALMAGARLFLEAFRGDSTLLFAGVRTAQVVAWVILAAALFGLDHLRLNYAMTKKLPQKGR